MTDTPDPGIPHGQTDTQVGGQKTFRQNGTELGKRQWRRGREPQKDERDIDDKDDAPGKETAVGLDVGLALRQRLKREQDVKGPGEPD
jgi:hypothetical protein